MVPIVDFKLSDYHLICCRHGRSAPGIQSFADRTVTSVFDSSRFCTLLVKNVMAVEGDDLLEPQDQILANHAHIFYFSVECLVSIWCTVCLLVVLQLSVINVGVGTLMKRRLVKLDRLDCVE